MRKSWISSLHSPVCMQTNLQKIKIKKNIGNFENKGTPKSGTQIKLFAPKKLIMSQNCRVQVMIAEL